MGVKVNAVKFGLTSRTELEKIGRNHYSIVVKRKSRLLMKDGEKILEKINVMREFVPGARVDLATNAPVCGKAAQYLKEHNIDIIKMP